MSPIKLDNLTALPKLEPASPAPRSPAAGRVDVEPFDEHLERARQTPATTASADSDEVGSGQGPAGQARVADEGHRDEPQRTSADQPEENTSPPTEPSEAEDDRPGEVAATSDTAEEADGSKTEGEAAAAESSRQANDEETGHGGEDSLDAGIGDACAPLGESDAGEAARGHDESDASRAAAAKESNKPAAAARELPTQETVELGRLQAEAARELPTQEAAESSRLQAEAAREENAVVAEQTEDDEGTRSREMAERVGQGTRQPVDPRAATAEPAATNQEQGEDVSAASEATDARAEKKQPEGQASEEKSQRHGGKNPSAGREDLQASTPPAKTVRSTSAEQHGTMDPQATSTSRTASADQLKAEAGDAAMKPTIGREPADGGQQASETGTSPRVASDQARPAGPPPDRHETSAAEQADRVRFVHRVARAFQAAGDRGGSVRLRLHPPELGSLRLELTVRNGLMTARLETETSAARSLLLDNLPALRERLAEHDVRIQRFDVELGNRSSGGSAQEPGDHPHRHDHSQAETPRATADREMDTDDTGAARPASRVGEEAQFDVTI